MKLIRPYYEILNPRDLKKASKEIERAARTCYKSENKIGLGTDEELIKILLDKHHEAMIEFGPDITVKFVCDRGVSHELVRHRLCSFAQESTRYCNYSKDKFDNQITFIIPVWSKSNFTSKDAPGIYVVDVSMKPEYTWFYHMLASESAYRRLIAEGWQPQEARSVLPNSLKTEIVVKTNIREWRHIFRLRCSKAAHPQMRELMIPLLKDFQKKCPLLFNDITLD